MEHAQLNWIAHFIWGIADDVLRDLYVRGKYRDVILPMTVLRRLDAVLDPTKQAVLDLKVSLDQAGIVHQDQALRQPAGQAFYEKGGIEASCAARCCPRLRMLGLCRAALRSGMRSASPATSTSPSRCVR